MTDKQQQDTKEVYQALDEFFQSYLIERNMEKVLSKVTDEIYSLGTGEEEIATNKEEFKQLLMSEFAVLPQTIPYKIMNYHEKKIGEVAWNCFCNVETCIQLNEEEKVFYTTRLTASFIKAQDQYLASVLHMSEGSSYQEENEFFPLRFSKDRTETLNKESQQDLMEIICQIMPGGVIGAYLEEGFPLYVVNEQILDLMGYTYDEFVEETGGYISNSIHEEDINFVTECIYKQLQLHKQYEIEYRLKRKDGSYIWVYDIGRKIHTNEGREAIISVVMDISENVRVKKNLLEETMRDSLTGLYNRKGGELLMQKYYEKEVPYVFLMMDIDKFKKINDIYGHYEGDKALCFLAQLFQKFSRHIDIVMRLGGDEFVIISYPCYRIDSVEKKLDEIVLQYKEMVKKEYPLSGSSLSFGGIHTNKEEAFETLYQEADKLLYEIKGKSDQVYKIVKQ